MPPQATSTASRECSAISFGSISMPVSSSSRKIPTSPMSSTASLPFSPASKGSSIGRLTSATARTTPARISPIEDD